MGELLRILLIGLLFPVAVELVKKIISFSYDDKTSELLILDDKGKKHSLHVDKEISASDLTVRISRAISMSEAVNSLVAKFAEDYGCGLLLDNSFDFELRGVSKSIAIEIKGSSANLGRNILEKYLHIIETNRIDVLVLIIVDDKVGVSNQLHRDIEDLKINVVPLFCKSSEKVAKPLKEILELLISQ
ncbi:hypothetical protein N1030_12845 [Desulfovibrio mangrovi]|uniref:hypothetical protein n=1 Tax=Desulfovibrio mangrovi TaxID=2976983 RepID=UPI002246949B|nr:hypothetical protein [Desulfovibrio mangrovi]UZP66489.1 hypothetical protein N1030_12845 [Desulfovibrio mangrovi]